MKRQYLYYEPSTGNISDSTGFVCATYSTGLFVELDEESKSTSIDDMIKLKNSGFTAEEVIAIKKANL